MNERIKLIRESKGLNQPQFAERLGVTKSTISRLEKGCSKITNQMIKLICREFNINEHWLREGTGEMFCSLDKFSLDDYLNNKGLNDEDKEIFKKIADVYVKINDDERKNFVKSLIDTIEIAFK